MAWRLKLFGQFDLTGPQGPVSLSSAKLSALLAILARAAGGGSAQLVLAGIAGSQLFNALTSFFIAKSANTFRFN